MLDAIVSLGISVSNAIHKRQRLKSSLRSDLETEREFFFSKAEIHTADLHVTKMLHFLLIASIIGDAWCRNNTNFGFIIVYIISIIFKWWTYRSLKFQYQLEDQLIGTTLTQLVAKGPSRKETLFCCSVKWSFKISQYALS